MHLGINLDSVVTWKKKRLPAGLWKRGEPNTGLREIASVRLQPLEELTGCVHTAWEGSMQETVQTTLWNTDLIFQKNRLQ